MAKPIKLDSSCIGTMYVLVDGKEIAVSHLISEIHWQNTSNLKELKDNLFKICVDDTAIKKQVRKIKLQMFWLSFKNLFTK